jgi:NADH-ubiquinone oxidoreductase chain 4L
MTLGVFDLNISRLRFDSLSLKHWSCKSETELFLKSMNSLLLIQISYFLALLAFVIQRYHLLMALLCLEGMILTLVLLIPSFLYLTNMLNISIFALVILTLGACEARIGLSILVNMSRSYGRDILISISTNKC